MNFIEEIIQAAQQRGEFSNLKGEGKPLSLSENYFDDETRLAYGLVKQAGFTLGFIAERKALLAALEELRQGLNTAARRLDGTPWGEIRWDKAVVRFREEGKKLNEQILTYNLKAPRERFHIIPLDLEREIRTSRPTR